MRARQIDAALREFPEVRHTVTTINSGFAQGKIYGSVYVRLIDRKDRTRSVDRADGAAARAAGAHPRHHRHQHRRQPTWAAARASSSRCRAATSPNWSGCRRRSWTGCAQIPGLVDLDSTLKPDKPTLAVEVKRDAAADLGPERQRAGRHAAHAGGRRQSVGNWRAADGENYDVRVRLAPAQPRRRGRPAQLPLVLGSNADGSARVVRLSQVAEVHAVDRPQPDQPPRPEPRDQHRRQRAGPQQRRGLGRHPRRARRHRLAAGLPLQLRRQHQEHDRSRSTTPWARWRWRWSSST